VVRADEDRLTQAIVTLASQFGRYGYRQITGLLRHAGWRVGKDRVQRIWKKEGLKVPKKTRTPGKTLAQRRFLHPSGWRREHRNHV